MYFSGIFFVFAYDLLEVAPRTSRGPIRIRYRQTTHTRGWRAYPRLRLEDRTTIDIFVFDQTKCHLASTSTRDVINCPRTNQNGSKRELLGFTIHPDAAISRRRPSDPIVRFRLGNDCLASQSLLCAVWSLSNRPRRSPGGTSPRRRNAPTEATGRRRLARFRFLF